MSSSRRFWCGRRSDIVDIIERNEQANRVEIVVVARRFR